jgi:hypothetical protein
VVQLITSVSLCAKLFSVLMWQRCIVRSDANDAVTFAVTSACDEVCVCVCVCVCVIFCCLFVLFSGNYF